MTTAVVERTPFGDVSNKENLAPMKSKNQAPSLPVDTQNGVQQVGYTPFCINLKWYNELRMTLYVFSLVPGRWK